MGPPGKIRVMLIDDHRHIHQAVSAVLNTASDIILVAQGSNGGEAIPLCDEYHPQIILMDVVMPVVDGIEATRLIHQRYPDIKILALSSFQDEESVHAMLKHGATGYVLKDSIINDLIPTIRLVATGKSVLSPEVKSALLNSPRPKTQTFGLTAREREVLRLMAEGLNNGEIAASLTISTSTVKFHINNLIHKMGVGTRSEAIVLAAKNELI